MTVTINVKLVNSKFNQAYADKENEGFETEDNIKFLWEDEFIVKGDVKEFKVINNTNYKLAGEYGDGNKFDFTIPDITMLECIMNSGSVTQLPFSKKAISKTEKTDNAKGIFFQVYLKSVREVINPMEGVYILKDDFPKELLPFIKSNEEEEE
jgi:hypothetical protein